MGGGYDSEGSVDSRNAGGRGGGKGPARGRGRYIIFILDVLCLFPGNVMFLVGNTSKALLMIHFVCLILYFCNLLLTY